MWSNQSAMITGCIMFAGIALAGMRSDLIKSLVGAALIAPDGISHSRRHRRRQAYPRNQKSLS
jgi:hypothetical protein